MDKLENLCREMKNSIAASGERLSAAAEEGKEFSFFEEVKPAFEEASELAECWKQEAEKWILEARPKHLHPVQLDSTAENFEQAVLQSFYKSTKRKRHRNMCESVSYIIDLILDGKSSGIPHE